MITTIIIFAVITIGPEVSLSDMMIIIWLAASLYKLIPRSLLQCQARFIAPLALLMYNIAFGGLSTIVT